MDITARKGTILRCIIIIIITIIKPAGLNAV